MDRETIKAIERADAKAQKRQAMMEAWEEALTSDE